MVGVILVVIIFSKARLSLNMRSYLLLIPILFHLMCLLFGLQAFVEYALEVRVDLKLLKLTDAWLLCLRVIPIGQHLN